MMIDPDGRDDEWSWDGETATRTHVDNGTDYVKVNGALLTDYDYSNGENRAFLSQVGAYYMNEAGINKSCTFYDVTSDNANGADALAHTNMNTYDCGFVLNKGCLNESANTVSNIVNSFVHEEVHTRGIEDEIAAIKTQMSHSSWGTVTEGFKAGIINYGVSTANSQTIRVNHPMELLMIFGPNNIDYYGGKFNNVINEVPCIAPRIK